MIKSKATWPVFVPLALMLVLTAAVPEGMLVVMGWTAAGFIAIKLRGKRLSTEGRGAQWRTGWRKVVLVSYHLFWWPWYVAQA